ncbi:MAG: hypothetical protein AAFQ54_09425 [Pseudomonadota bacterium]
MAAEETKQTPPQQPPLGIYESTRDTAISGSEVIAIGLSVAWLLGAAIFFLGMGGGQMFEPGNQGQLTFLMTLLAVFVPVAIIWVAASAARSARIVREESQRLQAAIDAMRQTYVAERQTHGLTPSPAVEKKIDELVAAAKQTETAVATFTSSRTPAVRRSSELQGSDDQPTLAFGTRAEDLAPPLATEDLIRALNFPETAEDQDGFSALRRALKDRKAASVVQASQDVLTLISHDGIYMDDMRPDRAKPEIWRRFAAGERGRQVAALGGIRDRSSLALTAGRMRSDTIFRDAAHHFLRRFDQLLVEFCEEASDAEIAALADTRTARAFMLLGRVTGMFS